MWLGIDFGTTNTSAAVKRGPTEDAELIALRAGAREPYDLVLGSIVYEAPGGKTFTGRDALFRQALDDEKEGRSGIIHREFKRWFASPRLACEYDELVPHYGPADHNDVPSYYEEKVRRRVPQDGATADDPHTGRAELLRAQRLLATQALDIALSKAKIRPSDIEKLILGVPLTFGEFSQRRYLEALGGLTIKGKPLFKGWRDALSRVTFLYEPLAAAIAHRELRGDAPETVLVFDMGGGTLDLAAIAMQPNARGILQPVRELGYDGLPVAGGALDRALVAHLRREHRKFGQAYEREQGVRRHLLEELAQEIKIGLSTATAY
ncbi:MAG TPA: Hsp70 family protein, partial [Planctomycetota bacterium]|nr:Hsp70 family protein [Planctomycetota bacterium]